MMKDNQKETTANFSYITNIKIDKWKVREIQQTDSTPNWLPLEIQYSLKIPLSNKKKKKSDRVPKKPAKWEL